MQKIIVDIEGHNVLERFINGYLRKDGILILRLVAANAGDLITTDIIAALWKNFLEDEKKRAKFSASALPPPALTHPAVSKLDDVDGDDSFREEFFH